MKRSAPLPGIPSLFSDAWAMYMSRFWLAVSLMAVLSAANVFTSPFIDSAILSVRTSIVMMLPAMLLILAGALVRMVAAMALLTVFDPDGVQTAVSVVRRIRDRFWTFTGAEILVQFMTAGSTMMLVVPGVVVAVRLACTLPVVMYENRGIKDSLRQSILYIRGRWWTALGRMLCIASAYIIANAIILRIFGTDTAPIALRIAGLFVSAVSMPFFVACCAVLYRQLRDSAPTEAITPRLRGMFFLSLAGIILMGIIPAAVLVAVNPARQMDLARQTMKKNVVLSARGAVREYMAIHGRLPESLSDLDQKSVSAMKKYQEEYSRLRYTVTDRGKSFSVCIMLDSSTEYCATPDHEGERPAATD